MADITLQRYAPAFGKEWNEFVEQSRNGTFLFNRGYMDYHSDRFRDFSIVARKGGRTIALLPANLREDEGGALLQSHAGLTYGGWILPARHTDAADMLALFSALGDFCRGEGIGALDYKPVPSIYHRMPSQDDLYALFRAGAVCTECNISCAIDMASNPGFNTQQRRNLKRALKQGGIRVEETSDIQLFHRLLSDCLAERHEAVPVHTADELSLLHDRFPDRIRLFMLIMDDEPQAGVCVYDTGIVAHSQYICSTPRGRELGLLTLLFEHLFHTFAARRYFDFGISNEDHGRYLNEGLYRQKSSLGGSGVAYQRFSLTF